MSRKKPPSSSSSAFDTWFEGLDRAGFDVLTIRDIAMLAWHASSDYEWKRYERRLADEASQSQKEAEG